MCLYSELTRKKKRELSSGVGGQNSASQRQRLMERERETGGSLGSLIIIQERGREVGGIGFGSTCHCRSSKGKKKKERFYCTELN